jgi:ferredoxin
MERWLGLAEQALRAVQPGLPEFDAARCLRARHRQGNCTACGDTCPRKALGDGPVPRPDTYACDGCAACVAVCPTGGLRSAPLSTAIGAWLETVAGGSESVVAVCCERAGGFERARDAGPAARLVLPCLGALRAADIVAAGARGAGEIQLLAPDCATCDRAPAGLAGASAAAVAVAAFAALGVAASVRRVTVPGGPGCSVPLATSLDREDSLSRRGLFELWRGRARRTVVEIMRETGSPARHVASQRSVPAWRERLEGDIATLLDRGNGGAEALPVELGVGLPTVEGTCDGCGLCALVCPFGALAVADTSVSCAPASCTACGLCAGVCPTGGLVLRPALPQAAAASNLPRTDRPAPVMPTSESGLTARAAAADRRMREAARSAAVRSRMRVE